MLKYIWITLALWNLWVFLLYAWDKRQAVTGDWRVTEKTLLWSSILGAGFGAFLSGQLFRHKIRKWYFWLAWMLGMALESGLIYFLWKGVA